MSLPGMLWLRLAACADELTAIDAAASRASQATHLRRSEQARQLQS